MFVHKQKKTKNTFFLISGQVLEDACCNVCLFIEIYIKKAWLPGKGKLLLVDKCSDQHDNMMNVCFEWGLKVQLRWKVKIQSQNSSNISNPYTKMSVY